MLGISTEKVRDVFETALRVAAGNFGAEGSDLRDQLVALLLRLLLQLLCRRRFALLIRHAATNSLKVSDLVEYVKVTVAYF